MNRACKVSQRSHALLVSCSAYLLLSCGLGSAIASAQEWIGTGSLGVQVKGAKGKAVLGAIVEIRYRDPFEDRDVGGPAPRTTDSKGQASFSGLALGTWSVTVSHPEHLSYIANVLLQRGGKPEVTGSFLEASGTGRGLLRVKVIKGQGRDLGTPTMIAQIETPVPKAAPREEPPSKVPAEPAAVELAEKPTEVVAEAKSPQAGEKEILTATPRESESLPEPLPPPAELPEEVPTSPTEESLPRTPPTEAAADNEPQVAQIPEDLAKPSARVSEPQPEVADEPLEPEQPVAQPEPRPTAATPSPPVTQRPPEPKPSEVPPPVAPASQPGPTEEVEESPLPITIESPTQVPTPSPPPAGPPPAEIDPQAGQPLPRLSKEAVSPPSEPEASIPEPPAGESSEPQAIEPPTAQKVLPIAPQGTVRSYRERTCLECLPGEWGASSTANVGAAVAGACPADAVDRARETVELLANQLGAGLGSYAGPLLATLADPVLEDLTVDQVTTVRDSVGAFLEPGSPCRLLLLAMPKGARISAFRYEAFEGARGGDCLGDEICPVGEARWLDNPAIERTGGATLAWALFENRSASMERLARITGYFSPSGTWRPAAR